MIRGSGNLKFRGDFNDVAKERLAARQAKREVETGHEPINLFSAGTLVKAWQKGKESQKRLS